ncbi:hypothetical protein PENSPDRAFT_681654 [Peniophora sp. CONT]|nr:hypothetical protein PENSPDRAFT_681654 [Peniophora sp. CONT]
MVDWTSPSTLFAQAVDFNKLLLVFIGIYFYEFIYSIEFDWMLITRRDSRRLLAKSVKWLLIKVINATEVLAGTCATILLFVRVGVVWRWDKRITAIFSVSYIAVTALSIRAVVLIEAGNIPDPLGPSCVTSGVKTNLPNVFAGLIEDIALVILLFVGLRRWNQARTYDLWHLLWNQVFLFLNYNELTALFFDAPFAFILPIAATRLYRSLTNFTGNRSQYTYESPTSYMPRLPLVPKLPRRFPDAMSSRKSTDAMDYEMDVMDIR